VHVHREQHDARPYWRFEVFGGSSLRSGGIADIPSQFVIGPRMNDIAQRGCISTVPSFACALRSKDQR
jgi:hypothetical protein